MNKQIRTVPAGAFLLINLPVFSLLLLIPAGGLWIILIPSWYRFGGIVLMIWGLSGAILLLHDYSTRKKQLYLRLLNLTYARDSIPQTEYLKSTFCGFCILWAILAHRDKSQRLRRGL